MNKLALISLTASAALIPAAVLANDQTVDPPKRWEDVPDVRMRTPAPPPPPPGTTWPAPPPVVRHAPPPHAAPPPPPVARHAAPQPAAPPPPVVRRVETVRVPAPPAAVHHTPPPHHAPTAHPGPAHADGHGDHGKMMGHRQGHADHDGGGTVKHFRVERHHPAPGYPGGAYHDGPYPMDGDDYGWMHDGDREAFYEDGYYPGDEDYGYDEGYGHHGGQAYPGGWYGYPAYHGGYGYWGLPTVTITETTVTHSSKACCDKPKPHKVKKRRYKSRR